MKNTITMAKAGVLGLLLASLASPAVAADTIVVGMVGQANALKWPIYIGLDKGFFDQRDLVLDLISVQSNAGAQQQLAVGALDLQVTSGIVDPIRAVSQGANVAIARIDGQIGPYALMAKPEITSIEDLEGRIISVGGANDITRTYVERMLEPHGLTSQDVDFIYAGATSARFAALQSGSADAAILNSPLNFAALDAGFNDIGRVADYAPDLPFSSTVVNKAWAAENPEVLKAFLDAYTESINWYYDPANKAEAVAIMVNAGGGEQADLERAYDFYAESEVFPPEGTINPERLDAIVQVLIANGDLEAGFDQSQLLLPTAAGGQ